MNFRMRAAPIASTAIGQHLQNLLGRTGRPDDRLGTPRTLANPPPEPPPLFSRPGIRYRYGRRATNTNSRPGRSGASRISSTTYPCSVSSASISARSRKRSVESDVRTSPSAAKA